MSRLLIRAGKSPFTPVAPEATLMQDVFNNNTGNFLFQHAVWEALSVAGTEIRANATLTERHETPDDDVEVINAEFDHFVVPLANAFRADFIERLDRLTDVVERLTIPVSVVGVGAQAPANLDLAELDPIRDSTRRFVAAVLDRSPSIGVRGEVTRQFLLDLGFDDASVEIIGCPSLFRRGPDFRVERTLKAIHSESDLALNLTPAVPGIGAFSIDQAARHPNLIYVGQDKRDLQLLLWGMDHAEVSDPLVPGHLRHPLVTEGRMIMFVDQWTWFDFLAQRDFAYGTRFHGNVAALMAGTPAMLLAHDSRTIELADYHGMPYRTVPAFDAPIHAEELYEQTDLSAFNAEMPEGFARYVSFLEKHNLSHVWTEPASRESFRERIEAVSFPPAVRPVTSPSMIEMTERLNWLRMGTVFDLTRHRDRFEYEFEHPSYTGPGTLHARRIKLLQKAVKDQEAALKEQSKQIEKLLRRIESLEHHPPIRFWRAISRRIRGFFKR